MNYYGSPSKAPPPTKKKATPIPVGSAPAGISKPTRPRTLPVYQTIQNMSQKLSREVPQDPNGLAQHAREHGVSLQEIESFDLTKLWGADAGSVARFLAMADVPFAPQQPAPLYQTGGPQQHTFEDGDGDDESSEMETPLPAPGAEPRRLMVTLHLPRVWVSKVRPTTARRRPIGRPTNHPSNNPTGRPTNRPSNPPGPPANAVYTTGTREIPVAVQDVVDEIQERAEQKTNSAGFPQRTDLRNLPSGMMDLDRRYGYISGHSALYGFYGDLRLFDEDTWKYLVSGGNGKDLRD